jgi:hypothetical protein
MSRLQVGDPGLAPNSVLDYIEDMLLELAELAHMSGEAALAKAICRAAETKPAGVECARASAADAKRADDAA